MHQEDLLVCNHPSPAPFHPFLPPAANQKKSVGGHFGGGKVQEMSEQAKEAEGGGAMTGQKEEAAEQRGSQ